jgi:hypothetical protein
MPRKDINQIAFAVLNSAASDVASPEPKACTPQRVQSVKPKLSDIKKSAKLPKRIQKN